MNAHSEPTRRIVARGIGLYSGAIVILVIMDAVIKWLSADYPTMQIVFFRAFFGLVPVLLWLTVSRRWAALRTKRPGAHIFRGLIGTAAAFCFFLAFRHMPLADAYAIAFTAPLFITALSVPILREAVGIHRWSAVAIGFAGVVIMLQPGVEGMAGFLSIGALAALAGAFFFALSMVLIRTFGRTETNAAMVFYAALVMVTVSACALPFGFVMPTAGDLALFIAVGLLGGTAVLGVTEAFKTAPAAILAPFEYTAMVWGVAVGFVVWGDLPNRWIIAGSVVVIGSGLYILHRETRRSRPPSSPLPHAPLSDASAPTDESGRP